MHMSITPRGGAMRLQRQICFKSYIELKLASTFTLGLNTAEITDYIKKWFK